MKQGTGKRRVAVTGMGVVSCLGNDVDTLWRHIKGGISGITALDRKEFKDIDSRVAGVVRDLNIESYLDRKESSRYDPFIQFGYAAARQALDQAAITDDAVDKARVGVCIGTGGGASRHC